MENRINLPKRIKPELKKLGLKLTDVISCCCADMTLQASFGESWAVLTKDTLYILHGDESAGARIFSGYPAVKRDEPDSLNFTVDSYELKDISEFNVLMQIVGGTFMIKDVSGDETALCQFSSQHTYMFQRFCELCSKVKKGEEITDKDIEIDDRERYCEKCGQLYPDANRKICPNCYDRSSVLSKLLSFYKPYIGKMIIVFICITVSCIVTLFSPYLSGTVLFDNILSKSPATAEFFGGQPNYALLLLLCVLAILLSKLVLQLICIIRDSITSIVVPSIVKNIKDKIFSSMSKLSLKFYTNAQTGSLLNRVLNDAQEITNFLVDGFPNFFVNVFLLIFSAVFMLILNWKLALFTVIALPTLLFIYKYAYRKWHVIYSIRAKRERKLSSRINDNITGARVVKAFGSEDIESSFFEKHSKNLRQAEINIRKQSIKISLATTLIYDIINYGVICLGAALILSGDELTYGLLITFNGFVSMLRSPMNYFSNFFNWSASAMTSAQRMFEIIEARSEITESDNPVWREIKGDIEFKSVVFGYVKERDVIKNVSFRVGSGQMLGIVGHSGVGKSTLANLLLRMYDVRLGEILIDGINIKEYSLDCLRRNIAIVSQETYIFLGSVLDNIRYGRPDAGFGEVVNAAKAAFAHDFIMAMPDGYDTIIGSSERQLSGGERQRISIARAILSNPRILILDEATASVDTQTERAIQKSIDKLVTGRTTISIAHRLSTLKSADSLIVLEDGKIVERGTSTQLLESRGIYYKLYQLQTKSLAMRGLE